ncbi:hypothetical protein SEA_NEOS5_98 [Mycobacterium phage Neos5]|uniref:Uncharacterized protein n=2 Tax=Pipefishvirus athena TaxID=1982916 RepID=A0A345MCT4_9CAUD|nr:hypothetical protein PHAEDRUS_94 [Mycobacterium phage Phaedrus]YP_002564197.1 gp99 [Mycobacterium phage Phlyer]YP_009018610.1 hypothetical protein CM10_gp100 [Mycobacterium phage Akoma]AHN84315.1 hypothetical protein HEATHCLIFF_99 [Mycobacterium phage Heathcliff]AKF15026.1 hypothetical protein SEA_ORANGEOSWALD_98 [Mycobacterium phage OrangeOswald]AKG94898.1 hypothetical protein SEA_COROFIN_99 [Mycobacterium phage Corofin]AUX82583.1 hypothetical protein SEA_RAGINGROOSTER_99 [Mycobacterium p
MAQDVNLGAVFDDALTADEWWDEFNANACCPDSVTAAARLCGCGGSGRIPTGISRLL